MKKNMNLNYRSRLLMLSGSILLALSSCTKTVPMEQVSPDKKEQNYSKALISSNEDYIYSASQQTSSMSASDAFPFSSSDNKRVRLQLTETGLRVMEVERDQRYAANPNNDKLVIEIPISHTQFECAKDKFGECTNTEVDNDKVPWKDRQSIKVKFEGVKSGQLDLLPIMESQTLGDNCYTQVGDGELISSQIEADAINFEVKRTFITNVECLGNIESLSDASISAVYHYSMVKASSVLSPGYKAISYPEGSKDEGAFGFFTTSKVKKDVDHNVTESSHVQIMNRWNPERKEITYYLSDEFSKPQNKKINDLTVQTVGNLNAGLAEAGVNFRINLKQPAGKSPGDIRNSMIVLVEDPTAASVIGYGPQTEDPLTGEIFAARTVMFLGTIQSTIKYTYDDIIRAKKEEAAAKATPNKVGVSAKSSLTLSPALAATVAAKKSSGKTFGINSAISQMQAAKEAARVAAEKAAPAGGSAAGGSALTGGSMNANMNLIKNELKNYKKSKNDLYTGKDFKSKFRYLQEVKNCAFRADALAGASGISERLLNEFPDDAKPWVELSDSEKQAVIDIILPEVWIPTLIHEMGHNLGLRHNFQGSEDKVNFYNDDELKARNIDHPIPFSSVMEYGDDLKALPVLGKYDIAALRFGYKREVDVVAKDGSVSTVAVPTTLNDLKLAADVTLKDYGYCTDEHTGINAGCRRFDLGTSYTEIVKNMIQSYEDLYKTRNFRNGRADFSLIGDYSYSRRIGSIFMDLRTMLEVRERIKYRFGLPEGHAVWNQVEWLKDLNDASALAGQHLAKVLAVPDVLCAVSMVNKPGDVVAVLPLSQLDPDALSCFKADLQNGGFAAYDGKILLVAQTGKMFNSKKDPNSTNNYADQIDVRGYWVDKVLATKVLFRRLTGVSTFDKNYDSFLDHNDVGAATLKLVDAIMNDNVVDNLEYTLADGSKASFDTAYELSSSQIIEKHMFSGIADRLGIRQNSPTKLQEIVSNVLAANAEDMSGANAQDKAIGPAMSVNRISELSTVTNVPGSASITFGTDTYIATPSNTLAKSIIANVVLSRIFEAVTPEKLEEIAAAKEAGTAQPVNATDAEKAVWAQDTAQIKDYVNGVIKSSDFYSGILQVLPNAR